jgi:hypothetical protein
MAIDPSVAPTAIGYKSGMDTLGARDEAFAILATGERTKAPGEGCHVAFNAPNRQGVDSFHSVALQHAPATARDDSRS